MAVTCNNPVAGRAEWQRTRRCGALRWRGGWVQRECVGRRKTDTDPRPSPAARRRPSGPGVCRGAGRPDVHDSGARRLLLVAAVAASCWPWASTLSAACCPAPPAIDSTASTASSANIASSASSASSASIAHPLGSPTLATLQPACAPRHRQGPLPSSRPPKRDPGDRRAKVGRPVGAQRRTAVACCGLPCPAPCAPAPVAQSLSHCVAHSPLTLDARHTLDTLTACATPTAPSRVTQPPRSPRSRPSNRTAALALALARSHASEPSHRTAPHRTPRPPGPAVRLDTDTNAFTLHRFRALRRKAKLKGRLLGTASALTAVMSAPSSAPVSPTSSKRSRSNDSTSSTTHPSLGTPPPATTTRSTPAVSTHNLLPALNLDPAPSPTQSPDTTPYPAFLGPRRTATLDTKWDDLEWAQMNRLRDSMAATDSEQPTQWAHCSGHVYASRNRYMNVHPYQANRVHLGVPEDAFDYINASPITLKSSKLGTVLKYIATQGPKGDSWSHFWRMIWQQNESPAVIVMVTKTHESGREKCYPYYPLSTANPDLRINEHDEFGDGFTHNLHLTDLSHDPEARTEVRELDMTTDDGTESRKVWHLLFEGWPDFSVPEGANKDALLKMVELSRQKNSNNSTNPRIVHCSAGIGRSGTFIALDWLLQELEEGSLDAVPDDDDPVVRVVEMLRDQRPMMVQSKQQFIFIYDTLRERWRERWISLHPEEASRLGIASSSSDDEPALKRQKSNGDGTADAAFASDAEERAKLEAELSGADFE